jgi:hypothetical protein
MTNTPTPDQHEPLLPYYVYLLLDPVQGNTPFYVGKGTGTRVNSHVAEVRRMLTLESSLPAGTAAGAGLPSVKRRRIMDILGSSLAPIELIVARFETEDEAFAVEATLINLVYGFDNLTNLNRGHGSSFMRSLKDVQKVQREVTAQAQIDKIPGIDLQIIKGVRDGAFKNDKIRGLTEAGAYDKLEELQAACGRLGLAWRDFSDKADRRFHPGESNGYLAVIVRVGQIDFSVSFTKSLTLAVLVIMTEATKSPLAQANLVRLHASLGPDFKLGPAKKNGTYADFAVKPKFDDWSIDALAALLLNFKAVTQAA